ncbi:MAG: alpha/beta fold hydrolase [Dehalococcoidales bacterium]|nr:alpha/beta fold hydrolase [Dehalococcoidales bacterium]
MAKIQSKTINIDGLDVNYYVAGQGEPLVVIHGGGGDARTWWDNITELSKKYTVYAPDLPGYGGSQPLDGTYFIPELSEFMEKFAAKLGLEKFYLVGHSLGGGVALDYALKMPHRVRKLVLVSSLCLGREIAFWVRLLSVPALLKSVGALSLAVLKGMKWLIMRMLNPALIIMPLSPASVYVGGSITTFRQQSLVLENRLSEIRVPTLLVWGAKDPIVPVRHAYAAAKVIPDCQVKVFEARGHNVHRDELRQFSDIVHVFLG